MKFFLTIAGTIILIFAFFKSVAQPSSPVTIDYTGKYKDGIYSGLNRLAQVINSPQISSKSREEILDFKNFSIFPICKTKISYINDTVNIKAFQISANSVVVIPEPNNGQAFGYSLYDGNLGLLGTIRSPIYFKAIKDFKVNKLFFTYFLDVDSSLNNTPAVYKEKSGRVLYFSTKDDSLVDIRKILIEKYGSISSFLTKSARQDTLKVYREEALNYDFKKDADSLIRNGWLFWTRFRPTDTAQCVKYLCNDINKKFRLKKSAMKKFRGLLVSKLSSKASDPAMPDNIYFLNVYITTLLNKILTSSQYASYYRKWKIDQLQYISICNQVFQRLTNVKTYDEVNRAYSGYFQNILLK